MLVLPIQKAWYDEILSGKKKEEYRNPNEYYTKRFSKAIAEISGNNEITKYNYFEFQDYLQRQSSPRTLRCLLRNGYGNDRPTVLIEADLYYRKGKIIYGGDPWETYYVLAIKSISDYA